MPYDNFMRNTVFQVGHGFTANPQGIASSATKSFIGSSYWFSQTSPGGSLLGAGGLELDHATKLITYQERFRNVAEGHQMSRFVVDGDGYVHWTGDFGSRMIHFDKATDSALLSNTTNGIYLHDGTWKYGKWLAATISGTDYLFFSYGGNADNGPIVVKRGIASALRSTNNDWDDEGTAPWSQTVASYLESPITNLYGGDMAVDSTGGIGITWTWHDSGGIANASDAYDVNFAYCPDPVDNLDEWFSVADLVNPVSLPIYDGDTDHDIVYSGNKIFTLGYDIVCDSNDTFWLLYGKEKDGSDTKFQNIDIHICHYDNGWIDTAITTTGDCMSRPNLVIDDNDNLYMYCTRRIGSDKHVYEYTSSIGDYTNWNSRSIWSTDSHYSTATTGVSTALRGTNTRDLVFFNKGNVYYWCSDMPFTGGTDENWTQNSSGVPASSDRKAWTGGGMMGFDFSRFDDESYKAYNTTLPATKCTVKFIYHHQAGDANGMALFGFFTDEEDYYACTQGTNGDTDAVVMRIDGGSPYAPTISLETCENTTTSNSGSISISDDTTYYCSFEFDGNGEVTLKVASDVAMKTLVGSIKKDLGGITQNSLDYTMLTNYPDGNSVNFTENIRGYFRDMAWLKE